MPEEIATKKIVAINLDSQKYELGDKFARENMINKNVDSDVNARLNFINGAEVNGKSVISDIDAQVETLDPNEPATVEVNTSESGEASIKFGLPQGKPGLATAFFSDDALCFTGEYTTSFLNSSLMIGE